MDCNGAFVRRVRSLLFAATLLLLFAPAPVRAGPQADLTAEGTVSGPNERYYGAYDVHFTDAPALQPGDIVRVIRGGEMVCEASVIIYSNGMAIVLPRGTSKLRQGDTVQFAGHRDPHLTFGDPDASEGTGPVTKGGIGSGPGTTSDVAPNASPSPVPVPGAASVPNQTGVYYDTNRNTNRNGNDQWTNDGTSTGSSSYNSGSSTYNGSGSYSYGYPPYVYTYGYQYGYPYPYSYPYYVYGCPTHYNIYVIQRPHRPCKPSPPPSTCWPSSPSNGLTPPPTRAGAAWTVPYPTWTATTPQAPAWNPPARPSFSPSFVRPSFSPPGYPSPSFSRPSPSFIRPSYSPPSRPSPSFIRPAPIHFRRR